MSGDQKSREHDHGACVRDALARAEATCREKGLRLTPIRAQVLELVWKSHKPVGAYDLLAQLGEVSGKTVQPPTVYRALDFLMTNGLVHKIESLNAYIGCAGGHGAGGQQFLICTRCGDAIELANADLANAVQRAGADAGFVPDRTIIEVTGTCTACAGSPGA